MKWSPNVFKVSLCAMSDAQVPLYGSEVFGLTYDKAVLPELARRLQLTFLGEESHNTEMCFLHSPELRPEFKVSFNLRDFTNFLNAALLGQGQVNGTEELGCGKLHIPYPEDPDFFWKLVAKGEEHKQKRHLRDVDASKKNWK